MIAGLPYDAEVEYLESKGAQRISSGIMSETPGLKLETRLWYDQFRSAYTPFFGCYSSEGANCVSLILQGSATNSGYATPGSVAGASLTVPLAPQIWHSISFDCDAHKCVVDGVQYSSNRVGSPFSSDIWLFGETRGPCQKGIRIGCFKIWTSNGLVRNFIPVRFTNSNGQPEGAMYDRVSRNLFRNAGTGAFTIGPDVATPVMGLHVFKSPAIAS